MRVAVGVSILFLRVGLVLLLLVARLRVVGLVVGVTQALFVSVLAETVRWGVDTSLVSACGLGVFLVSPRRGASVAAAAIVLFLTTTSSWCLTFGCFFLTRVFVANDDDDCIMTASVGCPFAAARFGLCVDDRVARDTG